MRLICPIEPFDAYQTIYTAYDDGRVLKQDGQLSISELVSYIPAYCFMNGISQVTLIGEPSYISTMVKEPIETLIEYSNVELEIEVVKEWQNI